MKRYLYITVGDVEPDILGPYKSEKERDKAAQAYKESEGDEDGVFALNINSKGIPSTFAYSAGFLERMDNK